MRVSIKYQDDVSLTMEEIVKQAHHNYGKNIVVEVMPETSKAYDLIYFGLQQLMTHEQLSLWYDNSSTYQQDIKKLRSSILYKVSEIVDQVIIDTEAKVA
jgi:hypothetical protein